MIYIGDNQPTIYLGDNEPVIYLGDNQVYPMGPFVGIRLTKSLTFPRTGGTLNLRVQASDNWEILGVPAWLTLSSTAGTSGKTVITATTQDNQTGSALTATLTGYTTNSAYSATCEVQQKFNVIPTDEFWYTSSDGSILTLSNFKIYDSGGTQLSYTQTQGSNNKVIIKFNGIPSSGTGSWFYNNTGYKLIDITLPEELVSLPSDIAFYNARNLYRFYGDSPLVSSDGKWLFRDALHTSIYSGVKTETNMVVPEGTTTMGSYSMNSALTLTDLTIASTVRTIDNYACEDLTALTDLYFLGSTPPSVMGSAFYRGHNNGTVHIPVGKTSAYRSALNGVSYIKNWTIVEDIV